MNRKSTRLARGAKCGGFGASGFPDEPGASATGVAPRAVSPASASAPNPHALRLNHSRRPMGDSTTVLSHTLAPLAGLAGEGLGADSFAFRSVPGWGCPPRNETKRNAKNETKVPALTPGPSSGFPGEGRKPDSFQ